MSEHNALAIRESEAATGNLSRVQPPKTQEDTFGVGRIETRAVIGNRKHVLPLSICRRSHMDARCLPCFAVLERVIDEVLEKYDDEARINGGRRRRTRTRS
jgi:hypothetical protein